jgi:hypothetical protein
MKQQYFAAEGQPGLTASKAQRLCVWANKAMMEDEAQLTSINFITESETCITKPNEAIITVVGDRKFDFNEEIEHMIALTSLMSWLHEAINEKERLTNKLNAISLEDWADMQGLKVPVCPQRSGRRVTKEDVINSWPADKLAHYYKLKNICAILHKVCGPDSTYERAIERVLWANKNPKAKSWHGELLYVTSYDPSVDIQRVLYQFKQYQRRHSDVQSELNALEYEAEAEAKRQTAENLKQYERDLEQYTIDLSEIRGKFEQWCLEESEKIRKLKIRVPENLMKIFNEVRSMGTEAVDVD